MTKANASALVADHHRAATQNATAPYDLVDALCDLPCHGRARSITSAAFLGIPLLSFACHIAVL
jgi:hypothetical protein